MLMQCPECELQVSDKAIACPHCGYPLQPDKTPRKPRSKNKRRRLPNGFGQISEIKNRNLRNPFRAMVTIGTDENGRPISKPLKPQAYFPTYNDAYAALVEYNKNPYELTSTTTMSDLYEKWIEEYAKTVANVYAVKQAWTFCSAVYNMRVSDVRIRHIKGCLENGTVEKHGVTTTASPAVQKSMKTLFNKMLDYAMEYELTDKNYSRMFTLSNNTRKELNTVKAMHIPFTPDEMEKLWQHVNDTPFTDLIIIQCYSGWRPQELGLIEMQNVDIKKWTFTGGLKTDAGKNRIVPIHTRIRHLVKRYYDEAIELNSPYLFNHVNPANRSNSIKLTYLRYKKRFKKIQDELGLDQQHRPHDGRKHFVTMAKEYNVDEYAIKYMVGHTINDITEKVYTKREIDWLQSEIEKIK